EGENAKTHFVFCNCRSAADHGWLRPFAGTNKTRRDHRGLFRLPIHQRSAPFAGWKGGGVCADGDRPEEEQERVFDLAMGGRWIGAGRAVDGGRIEGEFAEVESGWKDAGVCGLARRRRRS